MSQNSLVAANGTGAAVRSALNNALDTLVTLNSGASAPSTTFAYMWWADTTTGLLKIRNAANSAWITVGPLASIGLGMLLNSSVSKTGAYTVVAADKGLAILASNGSWTLTLTAVATLGDGFYVAVINTGAGTITIDANAAETIDGATTVTVAAGQSLVLYCTGSLWRIISYWPGFGTSGQVVTSGGSGVLPAMAASGQPSAATQAEMEAAASTTVYVTPGRTQYHPGVAKAVFYIENSVGTPSISRSYNVTSLTDNGVGTVDVNFTTVFSDTLFTFAGSTTDADGTGYVQKGGVAVGIQNVKVRNTADALKDADFEGACWGDQ